jgi:SSS family solute:Na+ symporter
MFWKRTTGHGAFLGLVAGSVAGFLTHGLTVAEGKGGYLGHVSDFPSTMAQNFWVAIWSWTVCFVVTIVVSLATKPKEETELANLVYGMSELPKDEHLPRHHRPAALAAVVAVLCILLNFLFW